MASFVAFVGDLIERLSQLYWATGALVVLGGFVLFVAEVVSHLLRRRERGPRVVNVHIDNVWVDGRSITTSKLADGESVPKSLPPPREE